MKVVLIQPSVVEPDKVKMANVRVDHGATGRSFHARYLTGTDLPIAMVRSLLHAGAVLR